MDTAVKHPPVFAGQKPATGAFMRVPKKLVDAAHRVYGRGDSYFNVYLDPTTGKQRPLFLRSGSEGAAWERAAIAENAWTLGHLQPLYAVRIRWKKPDGSLEPGYRPDRASPPLP